MRKFVAACCCAIVGLQVLIAVPLVTCVIMFAYMDAQSAPSMTMVQSSSPADFPSPVPYNPAVIPAPSYGTPMAISVPPLPAQNCQIPPPLSPQVTAIAEVREQNGSPLDGTVVAPDVATLPPAIDPFVATVQQITADEASRLEVELQGQLAEAAVQKIVADEETRSTPSLGKPTDQPQEPPVATLKPAEVVGSGPDCRPAQLVESLQTAAELLYLRAQALEIDSQFGRADQVRQLAREIRSEIDTLRRESQPTPPVPSTVTAASFDPYSADPAAVAPAPADPAPPANPKLENSIPPPDLPKAEAADSEPAALEAPAVETPKLPTIPAP